MSDSTPLAGTFDAPVVATAGSVDPAAPLVVLLHGRGSSERDIIGLVDHLPVGPAYAAVRGPVAAGGGHAWFANRGIGRPIGESLRQTMAWFRAWLDAIAPSGRPVLLVGFSGGAAFAGGLLLDDPSRFAGGAILYGTLPFDTGVPVVPARLAGVPVLVAQGETDTVIPRDLLDRTWTYLLGDSGAPAYARRDPGGHGLTSGTVVELGGWVAERLTLVTCRAPQPPGPTTWPTLDGGHLHARSGVRPVVSWTIPQEQRSDTSPLDLQEEVFERITALPGVTSGQSAISVPGARGFFIEPGPAALLDALLVPNAGEFAHLSPWPRRVPAPDPPAPSDSRCRGQGLGGRAPPGRCPPRARRGHAPRTA